MAFDQTTRNRLQKFVSSAREILSDEFTRQLQAVYGMDPKQGTVAESSSLKHLDDQQRQIADQLRETFEHYLANTPGRGDKDRAKQVLDRIVREQAFTVLNRLAAIRMAEARGFLIESVGNGQSSQGFQLYKYACETALGETGDAYSHYLFALFDEFALDLAVLFERDSPQGRLFPRDAALQELLNEINHTEIETLWAEDETIGWIYQYFNSQEERKKMRAESQAPRNSRELAVRNQFFTPRYVVEFLTDNTLGRIWYEMTQSNTDLVDSCRYLVRRPTEIFLKPGETAPAAEISDNEAPSHEELLKQPVYIPHRPLKDPRSIRMLDPACGSMHFGLYAFDLFERIYLEAWQLEQQLGPDAFTREGDLQALQRTFESFEAFKQEIPKLIIEHNIHGVDIDPRAVQIAGLSLWQRAQRAWHQQSIKPQQRLTIVKSNIVCAEPMPGEKALLQEFTSNLSPPVLGQLLEVIFDKMQLAGEAGTLLKIEEEIQTAIHEAREQWIKQSGSNGVSDMFQAELDAAIAQAKLGFDLRGIDDETFWDDAEQRILQALSNYADKAESNADQKRLFAEDAAKGFAFIDLCRKRFDVVLMNPPFGDPSEKLKDYLKANYPRQVQDLYCLFVERGGHLSLSPCLGAITSSSFLKYNDYSKYREYLLDGDLISNLADLGWGVLDDAYVSAAAYVIDSSNSKPWLVFDFQHTDSKGDELLDGCVNLIHAKTGPDLYIKRPEIFKGIDGFPLCYSFSDRFYEWISNSTKLSDITNNNGIGAGPHNFFFRLHWEVPEKEKMFFNRWPMLPNGGTFSPFYRSINLLIDWRGDGEFIKEHLRKKYPYLKGNVGIKIQREDMYFKEGITYGKKTDRFNAQLMPNGCIPSFEGIAVYPSSEGDKYWILSYLNTRFVAYYLNLTSGLHKNSVYLDRLPVPKFSEQEKSRLSELAIESIQLAESFHSMFETDSNFAIGDAINTIKTAGSIEEVSKWFVQIEIEMAKVTREIDDIVASSIPLDEKVIKDVCADQGGFYFDSKAKVKRQSLAMPKVLGKSELLDFLENNTSDEQDVFPNISISDDRKAWFKYYLISLAIKQILIQSSHCVLDLAESPESIDRKIVEQIFNDFDDSRIPIDLNFEEDASLISILKKPSEFFSHHYKEFSANGRNAPIYWPLQTPSGSFTLWVYYHRLNEQTLYTCVNDFVEPKLVQIEQDLNGLRSKSARSSQEEKKLEKFSDMAAELRDFRDELLRLAKFWKPNLNDGVQITAAPLWKLFQHKAWQKKLKETWASLESGDYDWAHLACSIWPQRVLEKCHQDKSLAIAHEVEDIFWSEIEVPIIRRGRDTSQTKLEWQPKDLSEAELNALIQNVISERGL